jgi:hypothetical protein
MAKRARAKFVRDSLCSCGFPVLGAHIPLGQLYIIHPDNIEQSTLVCGGCNARIGGPWVWVEKSEWGKAGYLPLAIFEIDEGLK